MGDHIMQAARRLLNKGQAFDARALALIKSCVQSVAAQAFISHDFCDLALCILATVFANVGAGPFVDVARARQVDRFVPVLVLSNVFAEAAPNSADGAVLARRFCEPGQADRDVRLARVATPILAARFQRLRDIGLCGGHRRNAAPTGVIPQNTAQHR